MILSNSKNIWIIYLSGMLIMILYSVWIDKCATVSFSLKKTYAFLKLLEAIYVYIYTSYVTILYFVVIFLIFNLSSLFFNIEQLDNKLEIRIFSMVKIIIKYFDANLKKFQHSSSH